MQQDLNVINRESIGILRDLDPKIKAEMEMLSQAYPSRMMTAEDRVKFDAENLPKYSEALKNVSDETLLVYMSGWAGIDKSISDNKLLEKEITRRIKEAANGNQDVMKGKYFETLLYLTTDGRKTSNQFYTDTHSIRENNEYIAANQGRIKAEDIKTYNFNQSVELNDVQAQALNNYRNFQSQNSNSNSGDRTMANDVNLGTYHDLFFKLGGCDKTADEFSELSEQKEIEAIKEKYAQWVAKYINVDEKNPPEEGLPNDIEAENRYFAKREEEVANAPEADKAQKRQDLNKEYDKAGWKKIQVGIAPEHSSMVLKTYHYNPNDPEYKDKSEDELRTMFTERLRKDMENQDKPKDNNPMNVQEGQENTGTPTNQDEHQDEHQDEWKADKEKFWKEHCGEREQECERDPEDKEGLSLNISKEGKKLGSVRYSDSKHASISGENGKTADYSVFLGIVKDAKRNNQAINFSGEMSPEFAAKLKLACEELGVQYQNAPKGKIDANSFADQLSDESKKKLEEYNNKQDYEKYLEQFKKDLAKGDGINLSGIKDEKEKIVAYAAAMVAIGSSMDLDKKNNKEKITAYQDVAAKEIEGAPDKRIDFEEKIAAKDENGMLKKDENGKVVMEDNPYYEAVKDLPQEARAALIGHNQGIRQQQVEAARGRLSNEDLRKRENEDIRRNAFRDNNHQYDESSTFNTKADREARQAAMQRYWENRRTNG